MSYNYMEMLYIGVEMIHISSEKIDLKNLINDNI